MDQKYVWHAFQLNALLFINFQVDTCFADIISNCESHCCSLLIILLFFVLPCAIWKKVVLKRKIVRHVWNEMTRQQRNIKNSKKLHLFQFNKNPADLFCGNHVKTKREGKEKSKRKYVQECVESKAKWFFNAFSVRIPCHSVCVIKEYVAPSTMSGRTSRIPSRNKLYARS